MGSFVRKDLKLMLRDRKELAILLLMPFILIAILGFALGGFINGEPLTLDMNYILVDEDDEAAGKERLIQDIHAAKLLPEEVKTQLIGVADALQPQELLMNLLDSEELAAVGTYTRMNMDEAREALEQEEAAAIVRIPENFTYNMMRKMLLNSGDGAFIHIEGSAEYALSAGILKDILESFAQHLNIQTAIQQITAEHAITVHMEEAQSEAPSAYGGVEFVSANEPFTSIQYYTFAMAVMFIMYVATSVASKAFAEKKYYTFDRIIIAGSHPLQFLSGKIVSTIIMAFLQLIILFSLSTLIFQSFIGKPIDFWYDILVVSAALALCIGGLASLLTSLNFLSQNQNTSEVFGGLLVMLLSLVGGSFFPTSQMSEWLGALGAWTPNGNALQAYIQVTQGAGIERYADEIVRLLIMSVLFIAVGLSIFPRRKVG